MSYKSAWVYFMKWLTGQYVFLCLFILNAFSYQQVSAHDELYAVNAVIKYTNAIVQSGFHIPLYIYYYDLEIQRYNNSDKTKSIGPYYFSHFYYNDSLDYYWSAYEKTEKHLSSVHRKSIANLLQQLKQNYLNQKNSIQLLRVYIANQDFKQDDFATYKRLRQDLLYSTANISFIFNQLEYFLKNNYQIVHVLTNKFVLNEKFYSQIEQYKLDLASLGIILQQQTENSSVNVEWALEQAEKNIQANCVNVLAIPNLPESIRNIINTYMVRQFDHTALLAASPVERLSQVWQQYNTLLHELNNEYERLPADCANFCYLLHLVEPLSSAITFPSASSVHTVLLVDVTASMRTDAKIESLNYSLQEISRMPDGNQYLSLIEFANNPVLAFSMKPPSSFSTTTVPVNKLSSGGEANLANAMQAAFNLLAANKTDNQIMHIIVFTDGVFLMKDEKNQFVEYLKINNIKCSVLVFNESEPKNDNLLKSLTLASKGELVWARKGNITSRLLNLIYFYLS